jgi:transcription-repair coupling factor (superfamily II helicase)
LLPDQYCPDVHERLVIYKRLANCTTQDQLLVMKEELIDRFGMPPPQTQALLECHQLRITAKSLGIVKIDASDAAIQLQFDMNADLDPMKLVTLLQTNRHARMNGPDKLRVTVAKEDIRQRADYIRTLIKDLT